MAVIAPLPWQQALWQRLIEQHADSRLAHALLLVGPVGLGKRRFAEALAHRLLCRQSQAANRPACGQCRSCRQLAGGAHPDVQLIEPEADNKPLKVDQIRALGEFMQRSSQGGGLKIALLEPAERMNPNAANALLKTLEEPPPARLIILVAHNPAGLPATIRSRCQRMTMSRPPAAAVLPWLAEQLTGPVDPELLLRLARGAPLRALALADGAQLTRRRECFQEYCRVLRGQGSPDQWAERWVGENATRILDWLLSWQQDMVRLKLCRRAPPSLVNADLAEPLQNLAEPLTAEQLDRQLVAIQALSPLLAAPLNLPLQMAALLSRLQAFR